jgi:hypothetical protein
MQQFDTTQPINNSIKAILNYPELTVDQPQLSQDSLGKRFITSSFKGKSNSPNVSYSKNSIPVNYQAEKLYIFGKIHNIRNLDWDGECIIKNSSNTTNSVIYTVFLLKTSKTAKSNTFFDDFSKLPARTTLEINDLLESPTSDILYKSGPNIKVIINTNVIKIKSDVSQFSNIHTLFTVNPEQYSIITNQSIDMVNVEGFQEGATSEEQYFECDMLDIDSDLAQTYSVPVSSGALINASQTDAATVFMNYIMYFIIFMFMFMGSPYLYNAIHEKWLDQMKLAYLKDDILDGYIKYRRIGGIITFVFFVFSLSFMIAGGVQKRTDYMAGGVIVAVAYAIGYISIVYKDLILVATDAANLATKNANAAITPAI